MMECFVKNGMICRKIRLTTSKACSVLIAAILVLCGIAAYGCSKQDEMAFSDFEALYIGNSYTLGTGSSTKKDGLYALTNSAFGASEMVCGSGTGFAPYAGVDRFEDPAPDSFMKLIETAASDLGERAEGVDAVLFISAMGDTRAFTQDSKNYENCLWRAIGETKKLFPNAKVLIYYAEGTGSPESQLVFGAEYPENQIMIDRLFQQKSDEYGYEYLGWGGQLINGHAEYFSPDGYHPNDAGYAILAENLKTQIREAISTSS